MNEFKKAKLGWWWWGGASSKLVRIKSLARKAKAKVKSLLFCFVLQGPTTTTHQRSHLRKVKQENKAAFTIFALVGGFLACWMPFVLVNFGSALFNYRIPHPLDVVSTLLVGCGACVNPFFYAWLDSSFRAAFKRILYPIFGRIGSAPAVTIVSHFSGQQ